MKTIYSLNKDWKFKKMTEVNSVILKDDFDMFESDTKTGLHSNYKGNSYYDGNWETVCLPHDWTVSEPPVPHGHSAQGYRVLGAVVYRKSFTLNQNLENKRIFLKFDAIAIKSSIYVNGIEVVRSECGYTPIFAEITDFIEQGKQTTVVVVADNRVKEGWWYEGGGIYGEACLIISEKSKIADEGVFVSPKKLDDNSWEVSVSAEIDGKDELLSVEFELEGCDKIIKRDCVDNSCTVKINVSNPRLWDIDDPQLYQISCRLYKGDELIDTENVTFGFRTITVDSKNGCLLNGRPIKIKGICLHHDHAGVGVAVNYQLHKYRLRKLKEMNCNAIRTVHNPQLKGFYKACDELGFLIMNETRHFSSTKECLNQLKSFVRRDRNHPSVMMWSLLNEEPIQCTKMGYKIARTMRELIMKEDGTRPITCGMNGPLESEGVVECVDIVGFNYLQYGYDDFHRIHPDLPIVGSENSAYMTTRHTAHTDLKNKRMCSFSTVLWENLDKWSASPGHSWKMVEERDFTIGEFYWCGFDYRSETYGYPSITSLYGTMDLCGFKKDSFYMQKALWRDEPLIESVYYQDYKKPGDMLICVYSNCSEYDLYIGGEFYKRYSNDKYNPEPVYFDEFCAKEYTLVGRTENKEVCKNTYTIAISPYNLEVELSKNELLSDGEDVCVVDVYLKGADGGIVYTANNRITFEVTGGADNVGVGNGDNTDHDCEKGTSRMLFAGCAQMILKSNGEENDAVVKIICEGIGEQVISLKHKKAEIKRSIESERNKLEILSWRASDLEEEYPSESNIANLRFSWIPTTVGYGKNLLYSGKKGYGAIAGQIAIPELMPNEQMQITFEEIVGNFYIYIDKNLVYQSDVSQKKLTLPLNFDKDAKGAIVTIIFKVDGNDCGICGNVYFEVIDM